MNRDDAQSFLQQWMDTLRVNLDTLDDSQRALVLATEDRLVSNEAIALPFVFSAGTGYLCVAVDSASLRRFREDVTAFIGPTYSIIELGDTLLPTADSRTETLANHGYSVGFGLRRAPSVSTEELRNQVLLMFATLTQDPTPIGQGPVSLGHLLRDFDWAARAGDADALDAALAAIKTTGELSEDNQRFLEVQRFAVLHDWQAVWDTGLMSYLLEVPRPQAVTDLLLQALWHERLVPASSSTDAGELARTFPDAIGTEYWPLFTSAQRVASPMARRMALLFAVTSDPVRSDVIDAVLDRTAPSPKTPPDSLLAELAALAAPPPQTSASPLELANEALQNAEFDRAISLLVDDASPEAVSIKVAAAFELDDIEPALTAIAEFRALNDLDQERLRSSPSMRRKIQSLEDGVSPVLKVSVAAPSSLESWIEVLETTPSWTQAIESAETGAAMWVVPAIPSIEPTAGRLAELYASAPDTLLPAVPHLMDFTERVADECGQSQAWPLWHALFVSLVLDDHASASDLAIVVNLLAHLLGLGPPAQSYLDIVDTTLDLWMRRLRSYEHLDWGLDTLDVLARNACPDPEARLRFLASLATTIEPMAYRLRSADRVYVELLYIECGQSDLIAFLNTDSAVEPDIATPSKWEVLAGKTLGLHCLFDPINRRLAEVVQQLVSRTDVAVDDSHDCSPHLQALCKKADVLVVVTQHAKHAGVNCVDQHAKPPTVVLKARRGRIGFSGVLQVIEDYVDELDNAMG